MASGGRRDTGRKAESDKKTDEKSQRERFIETAQKLEVDDSGEDFEKALKRVLRAMTADRRQR